MHFHYVYILQSSFHANRFDTGITTDLQARLKAHNQGKCKHTAKLKPWTITTAIAFTDEKKAIEFESYLKTASGRAFAKKRL